jgi:hypothetical protein
MAQFLRRGCRKKICWGVDIRVKISERTMVISRATKLLSWLQWAGLCAGLVASGVIRLELPPALIGGSVVLAALALGAWRGWDLRSRALYVVPFLMLLGSTAVFSWWYVQTRQQLLMLELALPALAALPLCAVAHAAIRPWLGSPPRSS